MLFLASIRFGETISALLITGAVSVLFSRVSVVARPTRVSVASGRVITLLVDVCDD